MRKTRFAGLTALDPGESISTDGGSFLSRNPEIIDHFLEIGARSHRHDGHAALADPLVALDVTALPTGGTLEADRTYAVCYTLVDESGGETKPSPITTVTTEPPLERPLDVPTGALELGAGGTLTIGTYYYVLTLVDGSGGETTAGPALEVVREAGAATARVRITELDVLLAATGADRYRIYRAKGQQGDYDLLVDGVAAEVLDDGSIALDCGVSPPTRNTTNSTASLEVTVPALTSDWRLYLALDGDFTVRSLYGPLREPADSNATLTIATAGVDEGSPPDVSTAVAGAQQINAETDIAGLAWRGPAADFAALPAGGNAEGDVRLALDTLTLYAWDGVAWQAASGGGGGGGGGTPASWGAPVATAADLAAISSPADGEARIVLDEAWTIYIYSGGWNPLWIQGPLRREESVTAVALAAGAGSDEQLYLAYGWTLYRLTTDRPARVRIYATEAHRTADVARAQGVAPTGDHGVLFDLVTSSTDLSWTLAPPVHGFNIDPLGDPTMYAAVRIDNLDATTEDVTVTVLALSTEE